MSSVVWRKKKKKKLATVIVGLFSLKENAPTKKDKTVNIALDSRKLNEITVKRKAQMPNKEELISRISRKIADGEAAEIRISKFDLDYAYGQLPLSKNAMDLCIFAITGGNFPATKDS